MLIFLHPVANQLALMKKILLLSMVISACSWIAMSYVSPASAYSGGAPPQWNLPFKQYYSANNGTQSNGSHYEIPAGVAVNVSEPYNGTPSDMNQDPISAWVDNRFPLATNSSFFLSIHQEAGDFEEWYSFTKNASASNTGKVYSIQCDPNTKIGLPIKDSPGTPYYTEYRNWPQSGLPIEGYTKEILVASGLPNLDRRDCGSSDLPYWSHSGSQSTRTRTVTIRGCKSITPITGAGGEQRLGKCYSESIEEKKDDGVTCPYYSLTYLGTYPAGCGGGYWEHVSCTTKEGVDCSYDVFVCTKWYCSDRYEETGTGSCTEPFYSYCYQAPPVGWSPGPETYYGSCWTRQYDITYICAYSDF
ncbi:MAG: hypothetical protein HQK59_11355 [Deltaproteobacteria bacterium]|nr:hypothetical protein [Deltaproteobacteria bacterium]MBF0526752.1 hypothetical protein [Deltaproteobacteria bacterium]